MVIGETHVLINNVRTFLDKKLFEKEYLLGGSGSNSYSCNYKTADLTKIPNSNVVDVSKSLKKIDRLKGNRILSGITPSGDGKLHIGNYLGAVRQFKELAKDNQCFLFIADIHALTTIQDGRILKKNIRELILSELALLGELENIVFFRQSDVPQHAELQSLLNNITPLGLIKRAHAYKDKLQKEAKEDDINMGLFSYPVLMAADILLYQTDIVPVGQDQKQHIEITRDIGERFNKVYRNNVFKLPEPFIPKKSAVVLGTDGKRKMSKSLGNIISIFENESMIRKQVMGTYTDPARKHATDPGHIIGNMVFSYLDYFGEKDEVEKLKTLYQSGKIGDVALKNILYEALMKYFQDSRKRYEQLKSAPLLVEKILTDGAKKAKMVAEKTVSQVKEKMGLS